MNISANGGVGTQLPVDVQAQASLMVLKKSIDLEAQNALQLLEALPQPSNPPNLGVNIDVKA